MLPLPIPGATVRSPKRQLTPARVQACAFDPGADAGRSMSAPQPISEAVSNRRVSHNRRAQDRATQLRASRHHQAGFRDVAGIPFCCSSSGRSRPLRLRTSRASQRAVGRDARWRACRAGPIRPHGQAGARHAGNFAGDHQGACRLTCRHGELSIEETAMPRAYPRPSLHRVVPAGHR